MSANVDFASLVVKANSSELKLLRNVLREVDGQATKTEKSTNVLSGAFSKLAVVAGGYLTLRKSVEVFKDMTRAGSDLYETINKGSVVLGDSFARVEQFADGAAKALGQSKKEAIDAASTFGIFGKSAGLTGDNLADFSIQFTQLASDFASFYNTSPEDAIIAIGAAMRGEQEPIRRYGILLDETTLRQAALEKGIVSTVKTALTPQQRVLAAGAEIMKQSSDAQGDFARTSDGLANKQRILTAEMENTKAVIGEQLIPIMEQFYELTSKIVGNKSLISFFGNLAKGVSVELDLLSGKSIDFIKTERGIGDALKKGGKEGINDLITQVEYLKIKWKEQNEVTEKFKEKLDYINTHTGNADPKAFVKRWEKERDALNALEEQIGITQMALDKLANPPSEKKTTDGKPAKTEDTSWAEFGKVLEATSKLNDQKFELLQKFKDDESALEEQSLEEAVARGVVYQQFLKDAKIAELQNIEDDNERELALHKNKFDELTALYDEGSKERLVIDRIEKAERDKIDKSQAESKLRNDKSTLKSAQYTFDAIMDATYAFGGEQTSFYKAMFVMKKSIALAESIMAIATGLAESSKAGWPQNLITMAGHIATTAGIIGEIASVSFSGAKDKVEQYLREHGA